MKFFGLFFVLFLWIILFFGVFKVFIDFKLFCFVLILIFLFRGVFFEVFDECIVGLVLGGYKFYKVSFVLYIFWVDWDLESGKGFVKLFFVRLVLEDSLRVGLIGEICVIGIVLDIV